MDIKTIVTDAVTSYAADMKFQRETQTYHRKMKLPMVRDLRFTPDGLIHFKGQSMPVLGSLATVETNGSINRTGGMFLHSKHDDREHWLTIEGPSGIFQVGIKGSRGSEHARQIANHINVANKTHREW